ncbi:hypothetical protein Tco_0319570 [Tanacetum coccineum]
MSSSSSSSHDTVTYTSVFSNSDRPSFGIPLVDVYGYESYASKATPWSPKHAPLLPAYALEYAPLVDDDLEPIEAQTLPAAVSPAPLSPNYSADFEPIKDDPQEAEEDPEEEDEELLALASSAPSIADLASPFEETKPFEEDELVCPHTPLPSSFDAHIEAWLAAPTPPSSSPSPLSPLSSPIPMISFPPLPSSPIYSDTIPRLTCRLGRELDFPLCRICSRLGRAQQLLLRDNDSHKIYVRLKDAQDDMVVLQAQLASSRWEAQYLCTRVISTEQEYTRDA